MARWAVRGTKGVWRGLVAFGETLLGGFPEGGEREALAEPLPGHPERLRPDVPLSAVERELAREWAKLREWLPTRSFW
ncbi:DUF6059 family protein [Streptomyces pluripotens]|uniref:DUF6059 family protein n=1 Tax=Streptomyces pluripotens TaxID=1355015 RepID=UPI0005830963|nr:DUF6059 family protein [Streptomyces pluripotens]